MRVEHPFGMGDEKIPIVLMCRGAFGFWSWELSFYCTIVLFFNGEKRRGLTSFYLSKNSSEQLSLKIGGKAEISKKFGADS